MSPEKHSRSVPHRPALATLTTTSPGPAIGGATSCMAARPGEEMTIARMVPFYTRSTCAACDIVSGESMAR